MFFVTTAAIELAIDRLFAMKARHVFNVLINFFVAIAAERGGIIAVAFIALFFVLGVRVVQGPWHQEFFDRKGTVRSGGVNFLDAF